MINKSLPWLFAGIIALSPTPIKSQTSNEFNAKSPLIENKTVIEDSILYEGKTIKIRKVIPGSSISEKEVSWIFKKDGAPINDTSYVILSEDDTFFCGVYADTLEYRISSDSLPVNYIVIKYEYIEKDLESLLLSDTTAIFVVEDGYPDRTKWVHLNVDRYEYPSFIHVRQEENKYFQYHEEDAHVELSAGREVITCFHPYTFYQYQLLSGRISVTVPIDIINESNDPQTINLNIYPNPTNLHINIQLSKKGNGTLTLYDIEGRVIDKKEVNSRDNIIIDASNLNSGNYIITFENDDGKKVSKKISIVK